MTFSEDFEMYLKRHIGKCGRRNRDLEENIRKTRKELKEKKEIVDDLKNDRKPYSKELKKARARLQSELRDRYGHPVPVAVFADLFDITDEKWKDAIEGRLGKTKYSHL